VGDCAAAAAAIAMLESTNFPLHAIRRPTLCRAQD
jgi:hypothetical protein